MGNWRISAWSCWQVQAKGERNISVWPRHRYTEDYETIMGVMRQSAQWIFMSQLGKSDSLNKPFPRTQKNVGVRSGDGFLEL